MIDAAEALRIGLVSRVVPHAELLPAALALAEKIAANPPLAVARLKAGLREALTRTGPRSAPGCRACSACSSRPKTTARAKAFLEAPAALRGAPGRRRRCRSSKARSRLRRRAGRGIGREIALDFAREGARWR